MEEREKGCGWLNQNIYKIEVGNLDSFSSLLLPHTSLLTDSGESGRVEREKRDRLEEEEEERKLNIRNHFSVLCKGRLCPSSLCKRESVAFFDFPPAKKKVQTTEGGSDKKSSKPKHLRKW